MTTIERQRRSTRGKHLQRQLEHSRRRSVHALVQPWLAGEIEMIADRDQTTVSAVIENALRRAFPYTPRRALITSHTSRLGFACPCEACRQACVGAYFRRPPRPPSRYFQAGIRAREAKVGVRGQS